MVAATAASQALDVSTASELGSLLLCYRSIRDPHARCCAGVHVNALRRRFGLPCASEGSGVFIEKRARAGTHPAIARARAAMHMEPRAALVCVQGIRERSYRAGGFLLLVRVALERGDLDSARAIAARIETHLFSQIARVDIAYALYRRGAVRDALRALYAVTDRRLAARVALMRAEVRLTLRHGTEAWSGADDASVRVSYEEPAWTCVRSRIEAAERADVMQSIALLRAGLRGRDSWLLDEAGRRIARDIRTSVTRRYWLDVAERSRVDIEHALVAMQRNDNARALDGLRGEYVAMRAERLVERELPEPSRRGLAALPIANGDAASIERAIYDEAIALSSLAPAKRRVLIATAQHCLRAALADPSGWDREVIAARLRTLVHLGGELATEALRKALVTLPAHAEITAKLVEAYAQLDARAAAQHVLARVTLLLDAGVDIERALSVIELHGGLPHGFAIAYRRARHELTRAQYDGPAWLADLCALTLGRVDTLYRIVRAIPSQTVIPPSAAQMLADLDDVPRQLVGLDHVGIAAVLAKETTLLEAMLVARAPSIDPKMPAWTTSWWKKQLGIAVKHTTVSREQVAKFVRLIGRRHWFDALCNSRLEDLGVTAVTSFLVGRREYRLRLLDKRLDLLTYVRFADVPARSCIRSDSHPCFPSDTNEPWKDPLTICLRVEWRRDAVFEPRGFFFGSFAIVDNAPALVMNSLHVKPKDPDVRAQVIRAFEQSICEPLGITRIGIANVHGGRGELPSNYVKRDVVVTRFRALAHGGQPLRYTYDDLCDANAPEKIEGLYWRQ